MCHTRDTLTVEGGCLGEGRDEELYSVVVDRHAQFFKMMLLFGVSLVFCLFCLLYVCKYSRGHTQVHMHMCRGLREILSVFRR